MRKAMPTWKTRSPFELNFDELTKESVDGVE